MAARELAAQQARRLVPSAIQKILAEQVAMAQPQQRAVVVRAAALADQAEQAAPVQVQMPR
jgi:hypothetical protein